MRIKSQIKIDKYIVKPFISSLNIFVRLAGFFLRIDHDLSKDFKRIAVCKYKGIGSIIRSTVLLKALKEKYPNAQIIFITTLANKPLLEKIKLVDTIITIDDSAFLKLISQLPGFIFKLIKSKPDVYFDLEIYSNFSSFITTFSLATNRIGFYLRSEQYRMGIYTHMMFYNIKSPIQNTYLQMGRLLQLKTTDYSLYDISQHLSHESKQKQINHSDYWVINPNASGLREERRWGEEKFRELISQIQKHYPEQKIVLTGSKKEESYVKQITKDFNPEKVISCAGKTSIDEFISILKNAKLLISVDSGPLHIALSIGTPAIGLFGPCSPEQYGVYKGLSYIYKNIYCSPCVHEFLNPPCKGNNLCMKQISVEEVFTAIKNKDEIKNENQILYTIDNDINVPGLIQRT